MTSLSDPRVPKGRHFFLRVQNVVCNASLGTSVDTRDVCEVLSGRLGFQVFPATHSICHQSGGVSLSVFDSGQLVISGSLSTSQALLTVYLAVAALNKLLHRTDLRVYNFQKQNIVFSCELGFQLNVSMFSSDDDANVKYTPELFDGAHWKTCELGNECLGFPDKKDRTKNVELCKGLHIGYVLFSAGKVLTTMIKSFSARAIAEERLNKVLLYQFGREHRNKQTPFQVSPEITASIAQRARDVKEEREARERAEWVMCEKVN